MVFADLAMLPVPEWPEDLFLLSFRPKKKYPPGILAGIFILTSPSYGRGVSPLGRGIESWESFYAFVSLRSSVL
jgi:hypothetical protein